MRVDLELAEWKDPPVGGTVIFHQQGHSRGWAAQKPIANGSGGNEILRASSLNGDQLSLSLFGESHSRCVGAQVRGCDRE